MARRLEIELTSARPDGTWTWRAAGALEPRGSLDASLLYEGAKAGDVVRAETEFGIEGITVIGVEPPRAPAAEEQNRIEILARPAAPGVTAQLAGRGRPLGEERRREDRGGRERAARTRPGGRPPSTPVPGARRGGERAPGGEPGRRGRAEHAPQAVSDQAQVRETAREAPGRGPEAQARRGRAKEVETAARAHPGRRAEGKPEATKTRREAGGGQHQRRLSPASTHRNAMLESLPPEQRPIAQQLLRGGIPAVRTALFFERERAREEGRPEPSTEGVIAIAESLVTKVKAAEWRDRAEAAVAAGDTLATRDLRALVNGSDVARDEASRELVVALREMLERRVEANRQAWAEEVARHLDAGQVIRALKLSSRPPDPGARFSAELAVRLRDAASEALSPSLTPERWLALLAVVSESPVRRTVKPQGLPPSPPPELLEAARQQCGRIPALAPLLGISVPPPPGPVRPNVPTRAAPGRRPLRPSRPAASSRANKRPSPTGAPPVAAPPADAARAEVEPAATASLPADAAPAIPAAEAAPATPQAEAAPATPQAEAAPATPAAEAASPAGEPEPPAGEPEPPAGEPEPPALVPGPSEALSSLDGSTEEENGAALDEAGAAQPS